MTGASKATDSRIVASIDAFFVDQRQASVPTAKAEAGNSALGAGHVWRFRSTDREQSTAAAI